jgi:hypothetical protein
MFAQVINLHIYTYHDSLGFPNPTRWALVIHALYFIRFTRMMGAQVQGLKYPRPFNHAEMWNAETDLSLTQLIH